MNPQQLKPRYDLKQNYSESLRSATILGVSSVAACFCVFGTVSNKSLLSKGLFASGCLSVSIIGKLAAATHRERNAIINDIEDISGAARTSEIAADMSPVMMQTPQALVVASPQAIDTNQELRRSMWLQARELTSTPTEKHPNGMSKLEVIRDVWKYGTPRYKVGQNEWHKLELEFGSIEKPKEDLTDSVKPE